MPEPNTLILFSVACLALLLVPGPAVLFIVARSVVLRAAGGARRALAADE